ncbi:MAG: hypothetical protein MI725_08285 [Pirellulales bacterium]|nr:hypothetical protein [Pirellulales bacterium]
MSLLTLFGIPKPFEGHDGVIQRNAIRSWTELGPEVEVLLFGDDAGTAEFAAELGIRHFAEVKKNERGTPILGDIFRQARGQAKSELLGYANSDILLLDDFLVAVKNVAQTMPGRFLMMGRRIDTDITEELNFNTADWRQEVLKLKDAHGKLAPRVCKDYFVFPKPLFEEFPDFVVGRANWDNWMVYHAHQSQIPVVDATEVTTVIHQNHDYAHLKKGFTESVTGSEAKANQKLAGGMHLVKGSVANWILTNDGIRKSRALSAWFPFLADMHRFTRLLSKISPWSLIKSR